MPKAQRKAVVAAAGLETKFVEDIKKVYEINKKPLGQGQFGTVYRATQKDSGNEVALKSISKAQIKK